jgi:hypothetical protein
MAIPLGYDYKDGFFWYSDGSGPYSFDGVATMTLISGGASTDGFSVALSSLKIFPGGPGYPITATGIVRNIPSGVYSLRCQTAGTIKLWDNVIAAGTVLLETIAMTAGQAIDINQITQFGVFATVTSGTYMLTDTGNT